MNRKELIKHVANKLNLSSKIVTAVVFEIVSAVRTTLKNSQPVQFFGLGKFFVKVQKSYVARNPQTGKPVKVPNKRVARFKFYPKLKKLLRAIPRKLKAGKNRKK